MLSSGSIVPGTKKNDIFPPGFVFRERAFFWKTFIKLVTQTLATQPPRTFRNTDAIVFRKLVKAIVDVLVPG